jgi:RNA 2',3'-cyclic 3'-phosphodiesterase
MRIRAFLGINFSVAVTRRVVDEVERRKAAVAQAGARVAWVPAANLHVTLKFLGSTPEEAIEAVRARVARVAEAAATPSIDARVRGVGAFPSLERPRVLWLGVEPREPIARLARELDAAMAELGYPREEREFHPHITVARVHDGADLRAAWSGDADAGGSALSEIVVYESKTLSKGAEYVARARVPLGKKQAKE